MFMEKSDLENWANSYIRFYSNPNEQKEGSDDFWASERFMDSDIQFSELHWSVILLITNKTEDRKVLGNLAAGPLEDLIANHGSLFIERIETESRKNPRFRCLLGGVWRSDPPEIWSRIEAARNHESW